MSTLNFSKVTVGQTLNFAKDFGEAVSGILSFNLNWGQINGRSVDLDAILVTKSNGQPVPATSPTTTVKKAGFLGKLFGQKDEVVTSGGSSASRGGRPGVRETFYFGKKTGQGVKHHGDDLTGASAKGEFIEVDLDKLPADIDELIFSVISFSGHNFNDLPFASIEAFTGSPRRPGRGLISMELTQFGNGTKAVVLAKVKKNAAGEWEVTGLQSEGRDGSVSGATKLSNNV